MLGERGGRYLQNVKTSRSASKRVDLFAKPSVGQEKSNGIGANFGRFVLQKEPTVDIKI